MVTKRILDKYISMSTEIAREADTEPEVAERVITVMERHIENNRRQPRPPPPEGGICLREAARKYGIPASTLSGWLREGLVEVLDHIGKFKYLKELQVKELSKLNRRTGVRTITN